MVRSTPASDAPPRSGARTHGGRSARRRARELALQGLYEWLVGGRDAAAIEGHLTGTEGFAKADRDYFRELLNGVIDCAASLRAEFERFIDREPRLLSPVEHGILLIGTYELKHRLEIPYRVVINEAIELAKGYGGTEGFRYVNGVLDKVAAELRGQEAAR